MLSTLARFSVRRRRLMVFGIWIPFAIAIIAASSAIGPDFRTEMGMPAGEANQAQLLLSEENPNEGGVSSQLVFQTAKTIDDPLVVKVINEALVAVEKINNVDVNSPYKVMSQVNRDRTIAFAQLSVPRLTQADYLSLAQRSRRQLLQSPLQVSTSNTAALCFRKWNYQRAKHSEFLQPSSSSFLRSARLLQWAFPSELR
jgi:uncharacterized membrane protein YdfJ with MMPL/SSD domain